MLAPLWNTIEIRIVCIVEDFDIPLNARPQNIFQVVSYDSLMNGSVFNSFKIDGLPKSA